MVLIVAVFLAAAAACTSPSHTDEDFRRKAAHSVEQAAGAVASAEFAALLAQRGQAIGPYLAVLTGAHAILAVDFAHVDGESARQAV